jgi:hypothetical protein
MILILQELLLRSFDFYATVTLALVDARLGVAVLPS